MTVIAIDGPSSAGKGTLARKLADFYGFQFLDTGRLYRALAFKMLEKQMDITNEAHAEAIALGMCLEDTYVSGLREEAIGMAASVVAAYPSVRAALLQFQRDFAAQGSPGAVLDGRDIGTSICPTADLKLFITASTSVRATRRLKELQSNGIDISYEAVLHDMQKRDERDQGRASSPLKPAEDACVLDTSGLNIDDVFTKAKACVDQVLSKKVNLSS